MAKSAGMMTKCDKCGDEYSQEDVDEDIIRFYNYKGQVLCELCYEEIRERGK